MSTLYLDSSALRGWSDCREFFRYTQRERIAPIKPNVYYQYGIAIHLMVESFWRGETEDQARECAYTHTNTYPIDMLNPKEYDTWNRMCDGTPAITAAYFNAVEYQPEQLLWVEKEWSIPYGTTGGTSVAAEANSRITNHNQDSSSGNAGGRRADIGNTDLSVTQVVLCGRMDRLMAGPRIVDVKTASEIGANWKQQYRQDKILDMQFALYDWYLCQQNMPPIEIYLEVLIKPYKLKESRYEKIDLTILTTPTYRKRFAQQLKWKVSEIVHYVENYSQQKPWPLAGGLACSSKYGMCAYQPLCAWGDSPKIMEDYEKRVPHLQIMQVKSL